jgi:transcriptional regulator with XRE-family HTH domain
VRRYRLEKNWSQEELAFESGLHQTYLSGIENGMRNPTVSILKKLAHALGVRPAALIGVNARSWRAAAPCAAPGYCAAALLPSKARSSARRPACGAPHRR